FKTLGLKSVVNVMALIMHDYRPYLVLEDSGGADLKTLQKSETFEIEQIVDIAVKTASALGEIYQSHIIHKDVKPANILFNPETGDLRLIDFSSSSIISRETPTVETAMLMTATLPYMSPEQTGRMNRMVDWRTDFYSLGVTLYELFTGRPPFEVTEPLELVHAHMALMPIPAHEINRNIPPVLSEIIFKLMAKDAEDRYQSAMGIVHDLKECRDQLSATGRIEAFEIAQKDVSDRLQIPQKLYGREREVERLLKDFEQVSFGACKMALVTGLAGIGKSALVREVQGAIVKTRAEHKKGYFISGKFDQLKRSIPYAPLIQAFQELIRQILSESDAEISTWKEKLLTALGPNGLVMIEVIPELELIIGGQPEVPMVGPVENINRFNYVFENFIRTFAAKEHPLVIFLDDLQWSDAASLKLIEMFISVQTEHLFLIGAYRDTEVDAAHPLTFALEEIRKSATEVEIIQLERLKENHVNQLLSETLSCDPERSKPLARVCFEKTLGNPFFLNQFIHSLYREGLVQFGPEKGNWQWDAAKIRQTDMTDNVVNLMISRIHGLSENVTHLLSLAACIGNRFDLELLSIVCGKTLQETADVLFEALREELVLPVDESYKYISISPQSSVSGIVSEHGDLSPVYGFLHDRIQQAAYSLIEEKERLEVHLKIGREMLKTIPEEGIEEHIFDIVDHLNLGSRLITDEKEREELAQLNLLAGNKSKLSAAYNPALDYLKSGMGMLKENCWQVQYELTLSLHEEAAEAAYLCGDFNEMEAFTERVLQQTKTVLDKIKVYELKIRVYESQNKLLDAVNTGLHVLKLLGVNYSQKPSQLHVLFSYLRVKLALLGKQPDVLIGLPEMTDLYKLAVIRITKKMGHSAYFAAPELAPVAIFDGVKLSVKHGNTAYSDFLYDTYGLVECGFMGNIDLGYQFGKLALQLLEKNDVKQTEPETQFIFNCFIEHWKRHIRETIKPLETAFQKGIELGDFENAALSLSIFLGYSFYSGNGLVGVQQEISRYIEPLIKLKTKKYISDFQRFRQLIVIFSGQSENSCCLTGEYFNEEEAIQTCLEANDHHGLFHIYSEKALLCYYFDEHNKALESAFLAEKYLEGVRATYFFSAFHFYYSLMLLGDDPNASKLKKRGALKKVTKNQRKMKKWAQHAPMNHLHKWQLVEAERARFLGKKEKAKEFYNQAIAGAKENLFIQEEALANELAAKFYLQEGDTETAGKYMKEARYCYDHWGGKAKVDHLEQKYPELLGDVSTEISRASIKDKDREHSHSTFSTTSKQVISEQLDLTSVMKASQVISSEIEIEKLLSRMMQIIIENAGAEKGCLILKPDGDFRIEAEGHIHQEKVQVLQSIPLEDFPEVPVTIIQYVARIKESIVLEDAAHEGEFTTDPYLMEHQPKS
ncbi:MAG: serine/threonine-protein kinase PknK, partial [Nitrospina sp.]|nr:serine/threonine-protein kinase PknK [Nitrospina sp.]